MELRTAVELSTPAGLEPLAPLEGAIGTSRACPGFALESTTGGLAGGYFASGTPFFLRWTHPAAMPTLDGERRLEADVSETVPLVPLWFGKVTGALDEESALLVNVITPAAIGETSTTACADKSGVRFDVAIGDQSMEEFPRARLTYYSAGSDAQPVATPDARMTTGVGMAVFTGLPVDTFMEVRGVKLGCRLKGRHASFTGRTILEAGYVSVATLEMSSEGIVTAAR